VSLQKIKINQFNKILLLQAGETAFSPLASRLPAAPCTRRSPQDRAGAMARGRCPGVPGLNGHLGSINYQFSGRFGVNKVFSIASVTGIELSPQFILIRTE